MKRLIYHSIIVLVFSYSIAHACTPPKSHYKYVSCTARTGIFLAAKDDGSPVALLDKKGNKTADLFTYQAVLPSEFKSGLLPAQKNGKVGYINNKGKVVIAFEYQPMNGKAWARGVHDGRIIIKQHGGFGVIDATGNIILAPNKAINHIGDFKHGKATVKEQYTSYQITKDGKRLTKTPTTTASINTITPIQNSKAKIVPKNIVPHQKDGKWGFVDEIGTPMIVYAFDEVKPYSEGLAAVRTGDNWGFIDLTGRLVIDFRFNKDGFILESSDAPNLPEPLLFTHGKAWIGSLNNGQKLCINPQGVNIDC